MKKRTLSFLLCVCLIAGLLSISVGAASFAALYDENGRMIAIAAVVFDGGEWVDLPADPLAATTKVFTVDDAFVPQNEAEIVEEESGEEPDPLPDNVPKTYQEFLKLSKAERMQLEDELGEDEYRALVLRLQSEYQGGATEYGDEVP